MSNGMGPCTSSVIFIREWNTGVEIAWVRWPEGPYKLVGPQDYFSKGPD